jgi:hypothetical protein
MKLFKSLLVAPAALGLLAPMSASANEVTINDFNAAEEIAVTNSRVDGLEARFNNLEAGSFSETTTASFSADMAIGAVDGDTTGEAVNAVYGFQIDLNTSFTGEDSFDVSIDAGSGQGSLDQLDLNSTTGDLLKVDGISYTFPLGDKTTVFVGDSVDGSSLYNTACVYGGQTINIDDCGNSGAAMASGIAGKTSAGASYDFGNGWTAALGYEGQGSVAGSGLFTKEGVDIFGGQVTYTGDSYGVSVTYSDFEGTNDTAYTAFNGYYTPDSAGSLPSISAGYETGSVEGGTDTEQWMVGLQWDEIGAGTLGVAIATDGHQADNASDLYVYEAFYSYPMNDGMTITPIVFIREASSTVDETGIVLKTSFSF